MKVRSDGLPLQTFLSSRDQHCSIQYGELAQLGERLVCNQEVTGSSPVFSTLVLVFRSCSLTTEYPANGSFFRPHTRSVHETDARPEVWGHKLQFQDERKFEFLMVKLLRAYGECLGARRR